MHPLRVGGRIGETVKGQSRSLHIFRRHRRYKFVKRKGAHRDDEPLAVGFIFYWSGEGWQYDCLDAVGQLISILIAHLP